MTDPDRPAHTAEPAEGADVPGNEPAGQTPHTEDPAEGGDRQEGGADTPDA